MPRIRYLKPDFFKDEDLAKLPYETRLLYAGLWGLADRAGRLEDRSERLKVEIFPYDNVDAEKGLEQLAQKKPSSGQPFINRYSINGQKYIQIINWSKHQKPHHTERESIIPPDPSMGNGKGNGKRLSPVKQPLDNGDITVKQPPIDNDNQQKSINLILDELKDLHPMNKNTALLLARLVQFLKNEHPDKLEKARQWAKIAKTKRNPVAYFVGIIKKETSWIGKKPTKIGEIIKQPTKLEPKPPLLR